MEDAQGQSSSVQFYKRNFSRSLTIVPDDSNKNSHGLVIINDILTIKPCVPGSDSTNSKLTIQPNNSLGDLLNSGTSNSVDQKSQMVLKFSQESGLNSNSAMQCLEAKNWDYNEAGQLFVQMKQNGQITPEMMR